MKDLFERLGESLKPETIEPNYDKLRLGATLSSMDGDNNNHGDCFNYGSVGGCDENCPAMLEGHCEIYNSDFTEK